MKYAGMSTSLFTICHIWILTNQTEIKMDDLAIHMDQLESDFILLE